MAREAANVRSTDDDPGASGDARPQPRVAVIILNWKRPLETLRCALSVARLDYDPVDIFICDNASGPDDQQAIDAGIAAALTDINAERARASRAPFFYGPTDDCPRDQNRIELVRNPANGGYAYGNNVGLRRAAATTDCRYFWILNNDTVVDPSALLSLVSAMARDSAIGLCGSQVRYLEEPDRVQTLGGGRFLRLRARCEQLGPASFGDGAPSVAEVEAALDYVNGAAVMVSRALLDRVGAMAEEYFLYWEEIDWACRAQAAGFRLGYADGSIVYHQVGLSAGTSDDGKPSPTSAFYLQRSKMLFLRKYRPGLIPVALLVAAKSVVLDMLRGERSAALATAKGTSSGLRTRRGSLGAGVGIGPPAIGW